MVQGVQVVGKLEGVLEDDFAVLNVSKAIVAHSCLTGYERELGHVHFRVADVSLALALNV